MPAHLAVELYLSARPKGAAVHRRALVIQALSVLASEAAPAGADGDAPISDLVELFGTEAIDTDILIESLAHLARQALRQLQPASQ
ncbi:hypothetical protein [Catenuloplanes japonicus]|uniref:hypothetical protein n=1 Tax=Catenuloplanes japonicus TaxID=33876 RepID=UPI0012F71B2C|nr:hypothetical protein [Catenuloplanes japonicus]